MRIVICGASGFVGSALTRHLRQRGHTVISAGRRPPADGIAMDFSAPDPARWAEALRGSDLVINCVGILVESRSQSFADLHTYGPQQLFAACLQAGVGRVMQISAGGDGECPLNTPYFTSKRAADQALQALPLAADIVHPTLIYGTNGGSARLFRLLASLPLLLLPAGGQQRLQAIHIDDFCAAVVALIEQPAQGTRRVQLTGQGSLTLAELLAHYRQGMGFAPARSLCLPAWLMQGLACLGGWLPGSLLTPDSWRMLQNARPLARDDSPALLGHAPRPVSEFITPAEAPALRQAALATWRGPLLRGVLAAVWLITAWLSLFVHPQADSLAMLARVGLHRGLAQAALIGASLLDLVFGLLTLFTAKRRLWLAQMAVIVGYSAIIAACLPEFLSHPFAPIVKNLPILALLLLLYAEETQA